MVRMMGKNAMVEMLRLEGVEYVFANPGTTELPFIDALQDAPDIFPDILEEDVLA